MPLFLHHLILSVAFAFTTWLIYLKIKHTSLIDINWVLGFFSLCLYDYIVYPSYFLTPDKYFKLTFFHVILLVLVGVWAMRLACFFAITRVLPGIQDTRYNYLKKSYKKNKEFNLLLNYLFQAFLQALLASVFLLGFYVRDVNMGGVVVGAIIASVAIIGQAVADYQLYAFKKVDTSNGVCKTGLWYYSRHPNYFFEISFWFGLAVLFYAATQNALGFLAPFYMYVIMRFLTGPLTEKISIAKRGALYLEYKKSTPMIFLNIFKGK